MNTLQLVGAVAALLTLAAFPTRAQEGNGNPFPNSVPGTTTYVQAQGSDVGSEVFASIEGRPGSNIAVVADATVGGLSNEAPVQTANSMPLGFEDGTLAFAYEQSVARHFAAQRVEAQRFAAQNFPVQSTAGRGAYDASGLGRLN